MKSAVLVHESFDEVWPWAADHWHERWRAEGEVIFRRFQGPCPSLAEALPAGEGVVRLAALGVAVAAADLGRLADLRELACTHPAAGLAEACAARGVAWHRHTSEGFWGQSVAEFALGLTLGALRRIPQTHRAMISGHEVWDYSPPQGAGRPGHRGQQYGDDPRFTSGTLAGKRVRIVGAGNIGSRYANWCRMMGADVAIWDPLAGEPCFHRAGARREHHLTRLMEQAEIFAPMLPLTERTRGLITAEHIAALPQGALVVMVTRSAICDAPAIYRRVLADELALAADVFDHEPVPLDSPLLGRHNVVHTPHNAGRTRDANHAWADDLLARFRPAKGVQPLCPRIP